MSYDVISRSDGSLVATSTSQPHRNSLYKQFKRYSIWLTLAGLYPWSATGGSPQTATTLCSKIRSAVSWIPAATLFILMILAALDRLTIMLIHRFDWENPTGLAAELRLATMVCFRSSVAVLIPLACHKTRKLDKVFRLLSLLCKDVFVEQPWKNRLMVVTSMLAILTVFFAGYFLSSGVFVLVHVITDPRGISNSTPTYYWSTEAAYSFFLLFARVSAMHIRLIFFIMVILLTSTAGLQFSIYYTRLKRAFRARSCLYASEQSDQKEVEIRLILSNHFTLSTAVAKADKILSPLLLVTVPFDLAMTVFIFAHLFNGSDAADILAYNTIRSSLLSNLVCGFDLVWMVIVLFGPIVTSAYLKQQAEKAVKEISFFIGCEDTESKFKRMLKKRANLIKDFPPALTLWSIAVLDKNIFLVVLGVLGTYLFIILEVSQW
ncbi:uncharacterized protein LOC129588344 [Paramacrobiotus metropolitanus]|uniref:uncharacterized protein LOC129588344 n=1 Tax=Paramacrobiotus metropolitanus TaxID=2943436 RepID=UPI0024460EC7|nr:uncharacterized protein LOC129588344 [Paramacrobiotus metropolitanus]